jgi:hypothetical protein
MLNRLPLAALLAATLCAGCSSPAPSDKLPEMTFSHLPPIQLKVANVQIENKAPANTDPSNVAMQFPVAPDQALTRWAQDRLKATGSSGTAHFTILQAAATGKSLPIDTGVTGLFKKEISDQYDTRIEAELSVTDASGREVGSVSSKSNHQATVREDASLIDRHKVMYDMVEKMMADFNAEMENGIRRNLSNSLQSLVF